MSDEPRVEEVKDHIKDGSAWLRLLYMVLFAIIYSVAEVVLFAVVVFQFLSVLFTGNRNEKLLALGGQLSTFIYQVLRYLTYNSDLKPYPFDEWPAAEAAKEERTEEPAEQKSQTAGPKAETAAAKPAAKPKAAPKRVRKPAAKKAEPKAEGKGEAKDSGDKTEETEK